jgi:serine phosphatase RsbU (regulator of sigma subunit)
MLPRKRPEVPGYDLCDFYKPAYDVGGDFFGYFPTADGCLVITIGDVCGKGVSAALAMAEFTAETRHAVTESGSIKRVMSHLNAFAFEHRLMFLPFVLAHLDPERHILTVANAGQLPPLHGNVDVAECEPLKVPRRGFPFGVVPAQEFHPSAFQLRPGDCVLFYTDGATEAMNAAGRLFGDERLQEAFRKSLSPSAPAVIASLVEEIERFCGSSSQRDDLCLVCLNRKA